MQKLNQATKIDHCARREAILFSVIANEMKQSRWTYLRLPRTKVLAMTNETGRSMVEMLGVLAVIGVLSVAGVAGYNVAMNKHKANEILNAASQRAMSVSSQIQSGATPSLGEFTEETVAGVSFAVNTSGGTTFTLTLSSVTPEVCVQMKANMGDNNNVNIADCPSSTGTLVLTYNKDLSAPVSTALPCTLTATDCASGSLVAGQCACTPAEDNESCTSWTTNQCGDGYYCQFTPSGCNDSSPRGVCKDITACRMGTAATFKYFTPSTNCKLDWWTAQAICKADGERTLVSLSDTKCENSASGSKCTSTTLSTIRSAGFKNSFWTIDLYKSDSCFAWSINNGDNVNPSLRYGYNWSVLCR